MSSALNILLLMADQLSASALPFYGNQVCRTPNWLAIRPHGPAGMSMRSVVEAGLCTRSLQFDYDDEVANKTVQKIHDLARRPESDAKPFF